jgi:hypothetical protein
MAEVDSKGFGDKMNPAFKGVWKKADHIEEPNWEEYLIGIQNWEDRLFINPELETQLRMMAWRRYNDVFRDKLDSENSSRPSFFSKGEQKASIEVPRLPEMMENCNNVASWLYEGNPDKAMDKADILRWLGRFELATQLLEIVKALSEFEDEIHQDRFTMLKELSDNRNASLTIV